MTRSQRYAEVNAILYASRGAIKGSDRMYAVELDRFQRFCPEFDSLRDDGERQTAVMAWRNLTQQS